MAQKPCPPRWVPRAEGKRVVTRLQGAAAKNNLLQRPIPFPGPVPAWRGTATSRIWGFVSWVGDSMSSSFKMQ